MSATPSYGTNVPSRSLPKGLAVASLVLGIIGLLTAFFLLGGLLGLVAVILGVLALGKIKRGEADGRGLALGGIITGALAMLLTILLLVTVGSFLSENSDEISELNDCVKAAGNNQNAVQVCRDRFESQVNP